MSYLKNRNSFSMVLEAPNLYKIIDALKILKREQSRRAG